MKIIQQDTSAHFLRFESKEEVIAELAAYCQENGIRGAHFTLIGAASEVVLLFYDLNVKEYKEKVLTQDLEITGVIGNIAVLSDKVMVHAHGSFSDETFAAFGGHVKSVTVSATAEVVLTILKNPVIRAFDEETGLNLLQER